ncbi:leucine-rich repeat domain-containing protein [Methylocystis parvus]|uniref:leucine-rich repeat domain-containing protein n=1 Tax=Methylocystis parvus TaxID=134 RepID=UPI003C725901
MKLDTHWLDSHKIDYVIAADGALHVGGSLGFRDTQITALPEGLHVGGSLDLRGTQITPLPEGLHVGGFLDLEGTQITALPEGLHVGGYLDLRGTQITALPEGLHVGGFLNLEGTQITALPEGLHVGGFLDLRGTQITALPEGLHVGGFLNLEGTQITALPEGLHVGGYLYLRGTQITALPEGLHVGGSLDLRGTQITALPEGLHVGGFLDLRGTQITALPEGLHVGGFLNLEGTQITALPDNLTAEEILFEGDIGEQSFAIFDGIGCVVLSKKEMDGVEVRHCRKSHFENGQCVGEAFFVASRGGENAHGDTIREAIEELAFKGGDRNVEQYRSIPLDTVKSPQDWAFVYRIVTGACQFGTREFMKSKGELKDSYTLAEILEQTRGAYGHEQFASVVAPGWRGDEIKSRVARRAVEAAREIHGENA